VPDDLQQTGPLVPDQITGVVLCGGASRRMGQDKAALEVAGEALLDRAIRMLTPHVHEVVLACGPAPRYEDRGLRLALDVASECGPLEGLRVGLAAATTEWVLALACDMPAAEGSLAVLLGGVREGDQVVHFTGSGLPEPLCTLYGPGALPALEEALARGERRMVCFWPSLSVRALAAPDGDVFSNVNTPEDLARARAAAR
jgi:molybdopterin-guanine dinucleotide biosynthesis protein A